MLFNSYIFVLLFLPIVLLGYFGLNHFKRYKTAMLFLVGMSLGFCAYMNTMSCVALFISVLVNYGFAYLISRSETIKIRKLCLIIGIIVNTTELLCCKYFNFFIDNMNAIFKTDISYLQLILPLGISFYTFTQIAYLVDTYQHECETYSFLEYTAHIAFFPKLIQGPITYHSELIPQFRSVENKKINYVNMCRGLYGFSLGLAKKVLIADTLARIVNVGYGSIEQMNSSSVLLVIISYSLQIYFDFSGYCDMANGVACMLNIELPINFNSPYKAISISDFWDRWHMTLTRFFTKYIYIPLGGSRRGKLRTYTNVMIVFLISGLWHGANWTFVLWGGLNGLIIVIEKLLKYHDWKFPRWIKIVGAFIISTFAWSVFRAPSFGDLALLWRQLFTGGFGVLYLPITEQFEKLMEINLLYRVGFGNIINAFPSVFPTLFIVILMLACYVMKNTQEKVKQMKFTVREMIVTAGLLFWSILSLSEISEFLYFNF